MILIGRHSLERPLILATWDRLTMSYIEVDGVVRTERRTDYAILKVPRVIIATEVALFESEFEGRYMVGGMLIERASAAPAVALKWRP
jgi:hypothetical protein